MNSPLLAPQVYTEDTFTRLGLRIIRKTSSLQQILARNTDKPGEAEINFHWGPPRRGRLRME